MELEAIRPDLDPEINHRKLETAHVLGYEEPGKLRLTKGSWSNMKAWSKKKRKEKTQNKADVDEKILTTNKRIHGSKDFDGITID